ncbi:MAG: fibronectin type III domain-containing protein, partial [Limisphaerales bacterium]
MRKPQPRKAAHRPGSLSPLLLLLLTLSSGPLLSAATPVGQWLFNANNPLAAEAGSALELTGQHALITGITPDDGAIRIGPGSHYSLNHGLPNSPGSLRNTYSLLIDFRIPQVGPWYCFFQTDPSNTSDGDCFIQANSGKIGVGQTGYSAATCPPNTWQRLLLTVDHSLGIYRLYLEGALILDAAPQAQDGRFSLSPELLLFADNDSEDNPIDVSQVAIYSTCLSETEAADLGGLSTTAGLATFITPPYLQDLRPDGLTIMWETDRPSTGRVEFWNEQESGLTTATPQPSGFGTTIHRCTITDLTPGTRYSYQSFLNDEPGPGGSFTTAPTTPVDFTFGVWSDSQGSNHNAYPPDPYAPTTAMMQHMVTNGVQFGVAVGDMAENGASYDDT